MSRIDVLRPFIEKNLAAMLETERVAPDGDGEYSFPHGSAEITLRLLDAPMPLAVPPFASDDTDSTPALTVVAPV